MVPQALPQIPGGRVSVVATPAWDSSRNVGGMYLRWDPIHVGPDSARCWLPGASFSSRPRCGNCLQVWRQEGEWSVCVGRHGDVSFKQDNLSELAFNWQGGLSGDQEFRVLGVVVIVPRFAIFHSHQVLIRHLPRATYFPPAPGVTHTQDWPHSHSGSLPCWLPQEGSHPWRRPIFPPRRLAGVTSPRALRPLRSRTRTASCAPPRPRESSTRTPPARRSGLAHAVSSVPGHGPNSRLFFGRPRPERGHWYSP